MSKYGQIYIGTILLEKNRHASGKQPSFRVSEWLARFAEAGFDGMELWEYHATRCAPEELAALETSSFPVTVFNSYAAVDDTGAKDRDAAARMAKRLRAQGLKYNVGKGPAARDVYLARTREWRAMFPASFRFLCECHPGTIIEEPAEARRFFDEAALPSFEIIVHPFNRLESLKGWFDAFGSAVTHAHLQMRGDDRLCRRFDSNPKVAKEAIHVMREEGFTGSFELEFTQGAQPGPAENEQIGDLWQNALRDLEFLKGLLA